MRRTLKAILGCNLSLLFSLLVLCLPPVQAADVTLKWDANSEPEFDHYEVFFREKGQSYDYDNPAWQGTSPVHTLLGLDDDITYYFVVRAVSLIKAEEVKSSDSREVCVLGLNDLDPGYDRGWTITSGELKGFRIMYDSSGPTPTLSDLSGISALNIPGVNGVGSPLALETQPSGISFNTPVKMFIPCPGFISADGIDVYYYDEVRMAWYLANGADDPDTVQPDAVGWMVEGSRQNHNYSDDPANDPSTIEIRVYHFSGVQAGVSVSSTASTSGGGGGGGCFIAAVMK